MAGFGAKDQLQDVKGDVPDDLSRLPSLEEDRVRGALNARFEANRIYTHINALLGAPPPPPSPSTSRILFFSRLIAPLRGDSQCSRLSHVVAVAMNPYKMLPLYDQKNLEAYNQYGVESPGPYVVSLPALSRTRPREKQHICPSGSSQPQCARASL